MELGLRIRAIRKAEGQTQPAFSKEVGMSFSALKKYEGLERKEISGLALEKISQTPRYTKYTLWLMTETTAPEAGQISPEIEEKRREASLG